MSLRTLLILVFVAMALTVAEPVNAAPPAQTTTEEPVIEQVVVTTSTAFTLTVRIDEVTTVDIPMQIDWRAQGPNDGNADEVFVTVDPTILRTGFFSITVSPALPSIGSLAIRFAEPEPEPVAAPITATTTTTATAPATTTAPSTGVPSAPAPTEPSTTEPVTTTAPVTSPVTVPPVNASTTNAVSNLRSGPGTDYPIVGSANVGDVVEIVGQSADGTWFVLANNSWIAAFLVNNPPVDLPVVEAPALPAPAAPAAPELPAAPEETTPTVIPTVTPTP
jgi:hypothetical protein